MIRVIIKKILGKSFIDLYRVVRKYVNKTIWYGNNAKCNICNSKIRKWRFYGDVEKKNRVCPVCYSFGRQRFIWYCIEKNIIKLKQDSKVLHIAPELSLRNKFKRIVLKNNYITGDLNEDDVDIKIDITDIQQPNENYDLIICLHVLEHVPDDDMALAEFYRVLKSGGTLVLQVPLSGLESTHEDDTIDSPQSRKLLYGQSDHLRLYGDNLESKIKHHGYDVTHFDPKKIVNQAEFDYFALDLPVTSASIYESESKLFLCKK